MKYFFPIILFIISGCDETCPEVNPECIDQSIIPKQNIKNSGDLVTYLLKEDSTYFSNGDTFYSDAIKLVPTQGYIQWKANCAFFVHENRYGLYFTNYGDTTRWRELLGNAYLREKILIFNFKLDLGIKQLLLDEDSFNQNKKLAKAKYAKIGGHGDLLDALWVVDLEKESTMELTKIDSINKIIEGNFNLYYKLSSQSPGSPVKYSDKAHFRCGKFKAKIYE